MRERLEFQADRIEMVLDMHRIPARVTGGTVAPRWIRFEVLPAVGAKISKIRRLSEELAAALDTANCRVARRGGAVDLEIPRDDPEPVHLLPLHRQIDHGEIPPLTAILGLGEDGEPLLIRLPSPDVAHVLVSGTTGSGKTVLLQTMIAHHRWECGIWNAEWLLNSTLRIPHSEFGTLVFPFHLVRLVLSHDGLVRIDSRPRSEIGFSW